MTVEWEIRSDASGSEASVVWMTGRSRLTVSLHHVRKFDETADIETELFNYPLEARDTRFHISVSEVGSN